MSFSIRVDHPRISKSLFRIAIPSLFFAKVSSEHENDPIDPIQKQQRTKYEAMVSTPRTAFRDKRAESR